MFCQEAFINIYLAGKKLQCPALCEKIRQLADLRDIAIPAHNYAPEKT